MHRAARFTIILLVAVLAMALVCAVACKPEQTGYIVTASYDKAQGSVTLSAPKQGKLYAEGEQVTVTVKPADGYEVQSVKVDGTEVSLTGGQYTFGVEKDTSVDVSFTASVKSYSISTTVTPSEGGSITLTAPNDGDKYISGTQVTVRVNVRNGYIFSALTVNGMPVSAQDGEYTFSITQDTALKAELVQVATIHVVTSDGGQAVPAQPLSGSEYVVGERIVLTITPDNGYVVDSIAVNGAYLDDIGNRVTIVAQATTNIEVTFATRAAVALRSISGSAVFEGTLGQMGEEPMYTFRYIFDSEEDMFLFESFYHGYPEDILLGRNVNGALVAIYHDEDGRARSVSMDGMEYDDWANPFAKVSALTDDGNAYSISGEDAAIVFEGLTKWSRESFPFESFTLTERDGVITGLSAVYEQMIVEFKVSEHGVARVPRDWVNDYSATANAPLREALERAASAKNYTLTIDGVSTNGKAYVTENAVYYTDGARGTNFLRRADGTSWRYTYDGEQVVLGSKYGDQIGNHLTFDYADKIPSFLLEDEEGTYYGWLEDCGDGVYRVRSTDLLRMTEMDGQMGLALTSVAATLTENFRLLGSPYSSYINRITCIATSLEIHIADGVLDSILFGFYDNRSGSTGTVTVTFGEWDSTVLPFRIPDEIIKGDSGIPSDMVAVWTDEKAKYELDISLDGLPKVNGAVVDSATYNATDGLTIVWQEQDVSKTGIVRLDGSRLHLEVSYLNGSETIREEYVLEKCNWGKMFGTYYSRYVNIDSTMTITNTGVTYRVDGGTVTATDIQFNGALMAFNLPIGGQVYMCMLMARDADGYTYQLQVYDSTTGMLAEMDTLCLGLTDFDGYEGKYTGTSTDGKVWTLDIGDGVSVSIDGSVQRLEYAVLLRIPNGSGYTDGLRIKMGTGLWMGTLGRSFADMQCVDGNSRIETLLTQDGYEPKSLEDMAGTYTDKDGKYQLTITDTVTFTISDAPAKVSVVRYEGDGELYLSVNGRLYIVVAEDDRIVCMSAEQTIYLYRADGTFGVEYQGVWATEQGEHIVRIGSQQLTVDNVQGESITKRPEGGYTFTVGGKQYTLTLADGVLTCATDGETLTLYCIEDEALLEYCGEYVSHDGEDHADGNYKLSISAKGLVFTDVQADQVYTITEYSCFDTETYDPETEETVRVRGVSFSIGTRHYELQISTSGSGESIILISQDPNESAQLVCYLMLANDDAQDTANA